MSKKREIIAQCTYDDRGLLIKVERTDEEIVRCKDCKWYYILNRHDRCDLLDLEARDIKPDWFCADGEMREDDT